MDMNVKKKWKRDTYDAPVHELPVDLPLITSQYEPAGRDVENVAVHAESALLMATKPAEPEQTQGRQMMSKVSTTSTGREGK